MALEIERRFLVTGEAWRAHAGPAQPLRQGYLAASADGVTVRLRIRGADQAWLTLKAAADATGLARHEFEYAIPLEDAEALWALAPHRLEKTRYNLDFPGGGWVVDCFAGANAPLVLAEVELSAVDQAVDIPPWCGAGVDRGRSMVQRRPCPSASAAVVAGGSSDLWVQGTPGTSSRFPLDLKGRRERP